jgi:hypothetical protein
MKPTWIKIRDDIDTDPKVLRIATLIAPYLSRYVFQEKAEDLLGVTPTLTCHVLRDVTCNALRRVWSAVARHQSNGIITDCDPELIDQLAGIPGMFRAMAAVHWVYYDTTTRTLTFANWDEFNARKARVTRTGAPAKTDAERQRDRRARLAQLKAESSESHGHGHDKTAVTLRDVTASHEQIEIEDRDFTLHPNADAIPSKAAVKAYADTHNRSDVTGNPITPETVEKWFDDRLKLGWQTPKGENLHDIRDWRADLRNYARTCKQAAPRYDPKGTSRQPRHQALQRDVTAGLSPNQINKL